MNKIFLILSFIAFDVYAQNSSLEVISNSIENSHMSFNTVDVEFIKTD